MAYTRINWQDLPSTSTPRNAANLNHMDAGIKENDDKLIGNKPMGNIIVEDIECKNLFTGLIKGIGLSTTKGNEYSSSTSATSDFIPVNFTEHTTYCLSLLTNTIRSFVGAYNSNKEFLGRTGVQRIRTMQLTADIFTGGSAQGTGEIAYIRVTQYESSGDSGTIDDIDNAEIQLEYGSSGTPYTEHKEFNSRAYLLWKNLAPTSEFAGQAITLNDNISKYKYYEIIYKIYSNSSYYKSTGKIPTLNNTLLSNSHIYNERRYVTISTETKISFENGIRYSSYGSSSTTTANTLLIPVMILAYK